MLEMYYRTYNKHNNDKFELQKEHMYKYHEAIKRIQVKMIVK